MKTSAHLNKIEFLKSASLAFLLCQVVACASKHAKDDPSLSAGSQILGSAISSEPLNFAAEGSDSQKISGLSTIHFDFDKATIKKTEVGLVSQDARWIKKHPGLKIQIEGNCDSRGSVEYNLALGERRAKAIYNSLIDEGVDKARLSYISYGEERPLVQGDTEEAYAQNRRANFVPLNATVNKLSSND